MSNKNELIDYKVKRAYESISEVQFLLENNKLFLAVNRIYYGSFYILSALAIKHNFKTSKHNILISWFNKEFVKTEKLDKRLGKFIHKAFDERTLSDYGDFINYTTDEVEKLFGEMKDFINEVSKLLN